MNYKCHVKRKFSVPPTRNEPNMLYTMLLLFNEIGLRQFDVSDINMQIYPREMLEFLFLDLLSFNLGDDFPEFCIVA